VVALVSVIVPLYNSERFINSTLASIAGQTVLPAEVIVVNDASTDASLEVASQWSALLPLSILDHPVNRGVGAARATGIAASSGSLIALLDADDFWLPDHLETMLQRYTDVGGIISANMLHWSKAEGISAVSGSMRNKVPVPEKQLATIYERNFVAPAALFSRTDYEFAGGFSELRKMEDWELWMRMIRTGVRVSTPKQETALHRIHEGSLSADRGHVELSLEVLPSLLSNLAHSEQRILRRTIRRRKGRQALIEGERSLVEGDTWQAISRMVFAAWVDRSFRGGLFGANSSVMLQAVANLLTLGYVARMRRKRGRTAMHGVTSR
jgi:teichuronic acid biosynthesis glycosyltransferase TuaG